MELSAILELKQQILADAAVRYHDRERYDTPVQAFLAQAPEKRLAVGYSKRARGDYRLEIRVQRWDQSAFRLARQIQQQVGGEANIEVIPRIQIPPKTALLAVTEGPQTPVLEKPGPLQIGISVGHRDGGAGTLGAFVGTPDGGSPFDRNHVLARLGNASTGGDGREPDFVYHPGREKGVGWAARTASPSCRLTSICPGRTVTILIAPWPGYCPTGTTRSTAFRPDTISPARGACCAC